MVYITPKDNIIIYYVPTLLVDKLTPVNMVSSTME